jgi:hypothetical protein
MSEHRIEVDDGISVWSIGPFASRDEAEKHLAETTAICAEEEKHIVEGEPKGGYDFTPADDINLAHENRERILNEGGVPPIGPVALVSASGELAACEAQLTTVCGYSVNTAEVSPVNLGLTPAAIDAIWEKALGDGLEPDDELLTGLAHGTMAALSAMGHDLGGVDASAPAGWTGLTLDSMATPELLVVSVSWLLVDREEATVTAASLAVKLRHAG